MKLKILCQLCGRKHILDTTESTHGWQNMRISQLIFNLNNWIDYEIWVCPSCNEECHHPQNDEIEEIFKRSLKPKESEFKGGR